MKFRIRYYYHIQTVSRRNKKALCYIHWEGTGSEWHLGTGLPLNSLTEHGVRAVLMAQLFVFACQRDSFDFFLRLLMLRRL